MPDLSASSFGIRRPSGERKAEMVAELRPLAKPLWRDVSAPCRLHRAPVC